MNKLLALVSALLLTPTAWAQVLPEVGADDFRISDAGVDGDPEFHARRPSVAYNAATDEYLVAWPGRDGDVFAGTFAQRLDAATGAEVGVNDFVVSDNGASSSPTAVVVNTALNEFVVVWSSFWSGQMGLYGRRIDAETGLAVGDEFRIRATDNVNVRLKGLVYNPNAGECFALWRERLPGNPSFQESLVVGRFDPVTGEGLGAFPVEVTPELFGPSSEPDVAFNALADEYLVVWPFEGKVYGQRFDGTTGLEVGADDFEIASLPTSITNAATPVIFDPQHDRYLVCWTVDGGLRGRLLSGAGAVPLGGEIDIADTEEASWAYANLARATVADEFLLTWVQFEGDAIGNVPVDALVFDANGDGNLDACTATAGGVSVLLGDGKGALGPGLSTPLPTRAWSITSGDFDGDGLEDVAVAAALEGAYVLEGQGDGSFAAPTQLTLGQDLRHAAAADFDGDGILDLAFLDTVAHQVVLVRGVGDGTFLAPSTTALPGEPRSFQTFDRNGDARADLAVLTEGADQVTLFLSDPGGSLVQETVIPVLAGFGVQPQVEVADVDENGTQDVVVVGVPGFGNFGALLYLADEAGDFPDPPARVPIANDTLFSTLADLDDDGDPELLVGIDDGLLVFPATEGASFGTAVLTPLEAVSSNGLVYGTGVTTPAVGDLDGDGSVDVAAVATVVAEVVAVFLGNGDATVQPGTRYVGADIEIRGRRLSSSGVPIGQGSFPISRMGEDWIAPYSAWGGAIAFDPLRSQYLVTWYGYDGDSLGSSAETEVHGQLLAVCPPGVGSEVVRVGGNPLALLGGTAGTPAVGETWRPVIDHGTFVPDALGDWLLVSTQPADIPFGDLGNLLCAPGIGGVFLFQAEPGSPFQVPIPADCTFAGFELCAQGFSVGSGGGLLTNALDVAVASL